MKAILSVCAGLSLMTAAAVPVVTECVMAQDKATRDVTITYKLSETPAVVTIDIETNVTDDVWVSIGGSVVGAALTGDVFKRITETKDVYTVGWKPIETWPNVKITGKGIRAVAKAWSVDDTPDYMVVDLAAESDARVRYYPSVDFLPGGLFGDNAYRQTKMVMRKVMAKDMPWTMGTTCEPGSMSGTTLSVANNKLAHPVQLTNNYYLGVFELTHGQWRTITGSLPTVVDKCRFDTDGEMRPIEQAYPTLVRGALNWPQSPTESSFLGKMRLRTGVDFDLPSEAQWEFACRAGSADGEFNDGSCWRCVVRSGVTVKGKSTTCVEVEDAPGRYCLNGGYVANEEETGYSEPLVPECGLTNGTIVVGSVYPPNAWGFYDMHGNVAEMCLDWYADDITGLNGAVQTDSTSSKGVVRGGGWRDSKGYAMLSTSRESISNNKYQYQTGVRVACRLGLK